MASYQIHSYSATIGPIRMPGMGTDPKQWAIGGFRCRQAKAGDFLDIAFMPEGVALPANTSSGTWHTSYRPASEFPYYADILRNERPLYMELDAARPAGHKITSAHEPVGEGE